MNRTILHRTAAAAATATALVVLAGCGSSSSSTTSTTTSTPTSSSSSPSATATTAANAVVTIKNFAFSGPVSVKPGSTVTVTNNDGAAHTVTADDSSAGFDVNVDPGKSATFTAPSKPGSYPFHCTYHSNMHGTLKVG